MTSWRKATYKEQELKILTRGSLDRWNIVISILKDVIQNLKEKEAIQLAVFSKDLRKLHPTGNVYNVIDFLNKHGITKPANRKHPHDIISLTVPSGLAILSNEIDAWNQVTQEKPLPELQAFALKIIRQSLDEIQTLLKGSTSI
jgi:hypothetical protein